MRWKKVPGFEDQYEVNENGVIRDYIHKIEIPSKIYNDGFNYVILEYKGESIKLKVCKTVACAFVPNPNYCPFVCHKDRNQLNDNFRNLIWSSEEEIYPDWYEVTDFPVYEINRKGEIRNKRTNMLIGRNPTEKGYRTVNLYKDGKPHRKFVHVLVATQFIPNPEKKEIVNHIDENRSNDCVENLEWVDAKENANHGNRAQKIRMRVSKPINEYDAYGKYIRTWVSATAFADHYGVARPPVVRCLHGTAPSVVGRIVRFYENDTSDIQPLSNAMKYTYYWLKYNYDKPVRPEDLYVPKTQREEVLKALDVLSGDSRISRNSLEKLHDLILDYILQLEKNIDALNREK